MGSRHQYIMNPATEGYLLSKRKCFCVSCFEPIQVGDAVTSRRSGNNLRIRCMKCSKKYHLA